MYVYSGRFLQQLCVGACVLQFVVSNIFGILILLASKVSKKGLPLKMQQTLVVFAQNSVEN